MGCWRLVSSVSPSNTWIPPRVARRAWWRGWSIGRPRCASSGNIPSSAPGRALLAPAYDQIKPPNAECARLTHNDYLEQASDSGIIGFLTFTGLIVGSIAYLYRYRLHRKWPFLHGQICRLAGIIGAVPALRHGVQFVLSGAGLACLFSVGMALGNGGGVMRMDDLVLKIEIDPDYLNRYRYRFSAFGSK